MICARCRIDPCWGDGCKLTDRCDCFASIALSQTDFHSVPVFSMAVRHIQFCYCDHESRHRNRTWCRDWIGFVQDMDARNLYLAVIIGTGILFALPGYALPLREWMPDLKGNRLALLKITSVPVLALTITQVLSVLKSPFPNQPGGQNNSLVSIFVCIHCVYGRSLSI